MTEIILPKSDDSNECLQNVISGVTFESFLQSKKTSSTEKGLSDVDAVNLRTSTTDILCHCNPHDACDNMPTTHLVVGYVQSGKTMSFTGVLAMAKDNGYRIAVVLTGITTNLLGQTSERLQNDLDLNPEENWFRYMDNPSEEDSSALIKLYRLSDQPMIVIPILKHRKYIEDVTKLFSNGKVRSIMGRETVLIIDDEADQASLNGYGFKNSKLSDPKKLKEETAIYSAIHGLRDKLPGNSYIQYTATPQANILITTQDILSPKSHTLLIPGEEYIGGKQFFEDENHGGLYGGKLVVKIPEQEVFHKKRNPLKSMPASLRNAIMLHIWAVILIVKWYKRHGIKQLTMMVHPTDIIDGNKTFEAWIRQEINRWSDALAKPDWHEDRLVLLEQFKTLLPDALQFYPQEDRPVFEDVECYLPDIINDSAIYRITGDSTDNANNIKWNAHHMNIVIGAQMLNRGFTVKNLATTYMPRYTTSVTNADTIEQRCRFFGYKKDYIQSCRVFLPDQCIQDYKSYVHHEEELRALLSTCSTLKEYEHRIMLNPRLRPTRLNVLPKRIIKSKLIGWLEFLYIENDRILMDNKLTMEPFVENYANLAKEFRTRSYDSSIYPEDSYRKHSMVMLPLKELLPILAAFRTPIFSESVDKSLAIRYLQYLDTLENNQVMVIFASRNKIRKRSLALTDGQQSDRIKKFSLFQGPSKITDTEKYCGDRNIYSEDVVTIQIHHLMLKDENSVFNREIETYSLAVYFPEKFETVYLSNMDENNSLSE